MSFADTLAEQAAREWCAANDLDYEGYSYVSYVIDGAGLMQLKVRGRVRGTVEFVTITGKLDGR